MPASTGLGKPRQGTHLSSLRTTHPRDPEGALLGPNFRTAGAKRANERPSMRTVGAKRAESGSLDIAA
jgi:hypothetical protein